MATFVNQSKNSATFLQYLRHGKEPTVGELADFTFESVVFQSGEVLKNVKFSDLVDIVWTNQNKS